MNAVAYCRYSTDNQTENSIQYQLDAVNEYCTKKGLTLVDVYSDEAKTGTNTNREGLQRLIQDAPLGKFQAVIIYDQSRLSRSIVDWFTLRETLRNARIALHSCSETIEDYEINPSAFLSEGVRALFNQQFILDTRKKIIAGQTSAAKQGKFLGGIPPLGYRIIDGKYTIHLAEAEAVRLIFDMYADGYGYRQIVEALQVKGCRNQKGKPIGHTAIHEILCNERYIGVYFWNTRLISYMRKWAGGGPNPNAVKIKDEIPRIVDDFVWERVRKRMKANKQNAANTAKREYLLSGKLMCESCGGAYVGVTSRNQRGYETRYYTCATKRRLKTCQSSNINANAIESLVVALIREFILNDNIIERAADSIIAATKSLEDGATKKAILKEIAECEKKIGNLLEFIASGSSSKSAREAVQLQEEKKAALIKKLEVYKRVEVDREKLIEKLREDAKKISADGDKFRAIIKSYTAKIRIAEDTLYVAFLGDSVTTDGGARALPFEVTIQYNRLTRSVIRVDYRMAA